MRGFTLLELLVSLMVFAAVVALVYGTVRIGSRSWQAGVARIEDADALRIGWSFVQRVLSNSRPEPSLIPDSSGLHFIGSPSSVELVADLPAQLGVGGLHVLSLQLEEPGGAGSSRLLLRRARLRRPGDADDGTADAAGVQEVALAEGVTGLSIRYYGTIGEGGARRWYTQWQDQPTLPALVMVTVELEGGSHWPLLVAHPRLGMSVAEVPPEEGAEDETPPQAPEEAEPRATVD
jgi:general secretion pathway protein J